MAKGYIVSGEVVREDGSIEFDVYSDDDPAELKRGVISKDALDKLSNDPNADPAAVFDEYRDRIAARAGDHWQANPMNAVIILGRGDF
jgi:hypothetical protein